MQSNGFIFLVGEFPGGHRLIGNSNILQGQITGQHGFAGNTESIPRISRWTAPHREICLSLERHINDERMLPNSVRISPLHRIDMRLFRLFISLGVSIQFVVDLLDF